MPIDMNDPWATWLSNSIIVNSSPRSPICLSSSVPVSSNTFRFSSLYRTAKLFGTSPDTTWGISSFAARNGTYRARIYISWACLHLRTKARNLGLGCFFRSSTAESMISAMQCLTHSAVVVGFANISWSSFCVGSDRWGAVVLHPATGQCGLVFFTLLITKSCLLAQGGVAADSSGEL